MKSTNKTKKKPTVRSHPLKLMGLLAFAAAFTLAPGASVAGPLQADERAIHRSLVRIVANGSTSSGFLYGDDNRTVITTLHSVLPPGGTIEVFCRGNPTNAAVKQYLQAADLVLLEAVEDLSALGCAPISGLTVEASAPGSGTDLYAFGFKPGNSRSAFSKKLSKASGDPENLGVLLPDKVLSKIRGPFMPDLRQPLYYVNGGIYPGYSGGPVFNDQGALVGVVQGGLDKGTSNHDWLVPSSTIASLLAAPEGRQLPDIDPSTFGYSSPPAEESFDTFIASGPVIAMSIAPGEFDPEIDPPIPEDDCDSEYYQHTWVRTRTRHFDELYDSSDPNDGLDQLLASILPPIATAAQANLQFDIYEEYCRGMVIAVPVGTELVYEEFNDGEWLVAVNALAMTNDQVMFRVSHEQFTFTLDDGSEIGPGHEDFIFEALEYYIDDCEALFDACELDNDLFRLVAYSDGSAILRAGIVGMDADGFIAYNYHSLVISGGEMLEVETRATLGENSAIELCFAAESAEACGEAYWQPTSFMLANLLTNITGRPVDEDPIVLTGTDLPEDEDSAPDPDGGAGGD